jgi:hypothetical protein
MVTGCCQSKRENWLNVKKITNAAAVKKQKVAKTPVKVAPPYFKRLKIFISPKRAKASMNKAKGINKR